MNKKKRTSDALEIMDKMWGHRPGHRESIQQGLFRLAIGELIRNAREAKNMTQAEMAKKVGTTQSSIARLEAAEYQNVKLETLIKIATALNRRVDVRLVRVKT